MTVTMVKEAPRLRLVRAAADHVKSNYHVFNSERRVGEVWQTFGRSFSGAWWASCDDCDRIKGRHFTRREALAWIEAHRGWPS